MVHIIITYTYCEKCGNKLKDDERKIGLCAECQGDLTGDLVNIDYK